MKSFMYVSLQIYKKQAVRAIMQYTGTESDNQVELRTFLRMLYSLFQKISTMRIYCRKRSGFSLKSRDRFFRLIASESRF